jgi:hypothetical protein
MPPEGHTPAAWTQRSSVQFLEWTGVCLHPFPGQDFGTGSHEIVKGERPEPSLDRGAMAVAHHSGIGEGLAQRGHQPYELFVGLAR